MKVESIAECSLGASAILSPALCDNQFEKKKNIFFLSGLLRQVLLYTIKFDWYPIWEVKKKSDRPISVKQGRVRGDKNIFKVGLEPTVKTVLSGHS